MQLLIIETKTQQYGVDADTDEAGLKAVDTGAAQPIVGSLNISRRVVIRPPDPTQTQVQSGVTLPLQQ